MRGEDLELKLSYFYPRHYVEKSIPLQALACVPQRKQTTALIGREAGIGPELV
jgi:hypothetical protein